MNEFLMNSSYFGLFFGLFAFWISTKISKALKSNLANPLLINTVIVILCLLVLDIDYETFNQGASHLTYFLTPATVALAIPMYKQVELLKKNIKAESEVLVLYNDGFIAISPSCGHKTLKVIRLKLKNLELSLELLKISGKIIPLISGSTRFQSII